ncbi:MAG: ABC transporter ATP-binding protein [Candidatus Nanopelagicaceae bacterium]|nr:ABC transporter ATP-binding protein [Candidatus Nanopelagicaceae bacterium]
MSTNRPARTAPREGGVRVGPMQGMFGAPPSKSKDFKGSLQRLLNELGPERKSLAFVLSLITISVVIGSFGPKILGQAVNHVFYGYLGRNLPSGITKAQAIAGIRAKGEIRLADMLEKSSVIPGQGIDFHAVSGLLFIVIALYLISSLFMWLQGYLMAGVTQRTVYRLRRLAEEKIGRLPLRYFDSQSRGDLLSRVTNDIDNISNSLQQGLSQILNSLLTIISVLAMMFWISPELALVSLIAIPLSMFVSLRIAKRSQKEFIAQWDWTGKLNGHVEEMHTGHALIKVFGQRERAIKDFSTLNDELYKSTFKAQFISGIIQPMTGLISNLIYVAIAVLGGYRVATGGMSLGDVQAFIQYSRQFGMPLSQIAGLANMVQSGVASAERLFELLDAQEEKPDAKKSEQIDRAIGEIQFRNVSFRYLPDQPLIENFSLSVKPGETIAIVGPTGAGKTTLVNLMMRFYEIDSGVITLDGIDIRNLTRDDLRRQFGMVLQDTWLFTGTMRENIAFGSPDPSHERVVESAKAANIDHFLRSLPNGYDSLLTDDNATVSNGERQLITIARAFMADPAILILDEATSSVDTRTEILVQQAMGRLRVGRTSFVIAHRLSTIRDADTILVMDNGQLVEQGSHSQLMANQGFYYDLYASQFTEATES